MNANFGIISPLDIKVKGGKRFRNEALAERALECIEKSIRLLDAEFNI